MTLQTFDRSCQRDQDIPLYELDNDPLPRSVQRIGDKFRLDAAAAAAQADGEGEGIDANQTARASG